MNLSVEYPVYNANHWPNCVMEYNNLSLSIVGPSGRHEPYWSTRFEIKPKIEDLRFDFVISICFIDL